MCNCKKTFRVDKSGGDVYLTMLIHKCCECRECKDEVENCFGGTPLPLDLPDCEAVSCIEMIEDNDTCEGTIKEVENYNAVDNIEIEGECDELL